MKYKTECIRSTVSMTDKEHYLDLKLTAENVGMFGSKIETEQFEKIESVLSKRYIKLPFGIRILI